jgi:hypothetical protein
MLLIVIFNAVLAIGIVSVIAALHAKAIVADHLHHGGERSAVWTVGNRTVRPARTPQYWPARRPAAAHTGARRRVATAAR